MWRERLEEFSVVRGRIRLTSQKFSKIAFRWDANNATDYGVNHFPDSLPGKLFFVEEGSRNLLRIEKSDQRMVVRRRVVLMTLLMLIRHVSGTQCTR